MDFNADPLYGTTRSDNHMENIILDAAPGCLSGTKSEGINRHRAIFRQLHPAQPAAVGY